VAALLAMVAALRWRGHGCGHDASMRLLLAAVVASLLLVGVYLAAGGRDYRPLATADPCRPRSWPDVHGTTQIAEQVAYSALDGAAASWARRARS